MRNCNHKWIKNREEAWVCHICGIECKEELRRIEQEEHFTPLEDV